MDGILAVSAPSPSKQNEYTSCKLFYFSNYKFYFAYLKFDLSKTIGVKCKMQTSVSKCWDKKMVGGCPKHGAVAASKVDEH